MEFYYSFLTGKEKNIYVKILSGLKKRAKIIHIPCAFSENQWIDLVSKISWDHPELFYVDFQRVAYTKAAFGMQYTPSYYVDAAEERSVCAAAEAVLRQMQAKNMATPFAKSRWIHNYLVKNISYDYRSLTTSNRDAHTICGVFKAGSAVCEGIAKAFEYLCDLAGIPATLAVGKATSEAFGDDTRHAWNLVQMGESWYHIDVTFDLGMSQATKDYRYDYFYLADAEIARDHIFQLPISCPSSSLSYFEQTGSLIENLKGLQAYASHRAAQKHKTFYFKVVAADSVDFQAVCSKVDAVMFEFLSQAGTRYITANNWKQKIFYYRLLEE